MSFACGSSVCPCDFCIQHYRDHFRCIGRKGTSRSVWIPDYDGHEIMLPDVQALRAHVTYHILRGDKIIKNPFGVLSEHQED